MRRRRWRVLLGSVAARIRCGIVYVCSWFMQVDGGLGCAHTGVAFEIETSAEVRVSTGCGWLCLQSRQGQAPEQTHSDQVAGLWYVKCYV